MADLDFSFLNEYTGQILGGIVSTLLMTVLALIPGAILGVFCALARVHGSMALISSVAA